jgi:hypothetical protein
MSGLTLEQFQKTLGGKIEQDAQGRRVLRCPGPGHSKNDRSLSIWLRDDPEGFGVHSFSDADQDVNQLRDWVRSETGLPPWKPNGKGNGKGRAEIIAKYVYQDADGQPVMIVNRTKAKQFYQQRPDGRGGWEWGGIPADAKVPFQLPELIEAIALGKTVHVAEGEKGALSLTERGYAATCSPGGAGKWPAHFGPRWFSGANVIVLPDADSSGCNHAEKVKVNLEGVAASVRIVNLPGLPPGGDVFDFLAAGGDPATITEMAARPRRPEQPHEFTAFELQRMEIEPAKEVVPDLLAEGLTLLAGAPKRGKSWLALDLCCGVAGGRFVLDVKCAEGDVLFCALEDGARRLQRRMAKVMAGGGDWPRRLTCWTKLEKFDAGGEERLRAWIERQAEPKLIVLDTLNYIRPARLRDEDWYSWDYRCATLIKRLADDYRLAILAIHHTRKSAADDALESASGSNGLTGGCDAVMVLTASSDGTVLQGRSRDLEDFAHAVSFGRDTCRWSLLGPASEVGLTEHRRAILEALRGAGEPMSARELHAVTGLREDHVRQLLHRMGQPPEPTVLRATRGRYTAAPSQASRPSQTDHDE